MCLQKHGGNSAAGKGGHGAGDNLAGTAFRGGGGLGSASGGGGGAGSRGLGRVGDGEGGAVRVLGHGHDTDGVGARRDGGGDGGVVDGGKVSRAIQGADRSHVLDSSRGAVDKLDVDSLSSSTHAGTVAGPAQVLGLANFPGGGSGGVAIKKKRRYVDIEGGSASWSFLQTGMGRTRAGSGKKVYRGRLDMRALCHYQRT